MGCFPFVTPKISMSDIHHQPDGHIVCMRSFLEHDVEAVFQRQIAHVVKARRGIIAGSERRARPTQRQWRQHDRTAAPDPLASNW